MQHKSTLAKVTSPVEGSVQWICEIDDIRAGDIIQCVGFGPIIDGQKWLVGDCTRSVFQVYSNLTLVPPIQPQPVGTTGGNNPAASQPGAGTVIARMISAASTINNQKLPYVWGGGHGKAGSPSTGQAGGPGFNGIRVGFDCSGAVGAVLHAGGLVSGSFGNDVDLVGILQKAKLLAPGQGNGTPECTLFDNPGVHIYMRLNGKYWGTAAGSLPSNGSGVGWINGGSAQNGFTAYHIPQNLLEQLN